MILRARVGGGGREYPFSRVAFALSSERFWDGEAFIVLVLVHATGEAGDGGRYDESDP